MEDERSVELIARLRDRLAATAPSAIEPQGADRRAAVALIVRASADPAILFVARAIATGDPWSGHAAFPGGHVDPGDRDLIDTARRETREEVGIHLARDAFLGRLDDVRPQSRTPSVVVSPFVAWVDEDPAIVTNYEIERHVWVPASALRDPAHGSEVVLERTVEPRRFPAIAVEDLTVWGLTHRIVTNFLDLAAEDILGGTHIQDGGNR